MEMGFNAIQTRKAENEFTYQVKQVMAAGTMLLLAFVVTTGAATVVAQAVRAVM